MRSGVYRWSRDSFLSADPLEDHTLRGFARYARFAKAAVDPMLSDDNGVSATPLTTALVEEVDRLSIVSRLTAAGALRTLILPAGSARVVVGTLAASEVDEAAGKPVNRLDFARNAAPTKAATTVVLSAEFARSFSPENQRAIGRAVERAVAREVDRVLLGLLTAGTPAGTSDVGTPLGLLSGGDPAAPMIMASYGDLLAQAPALRDMRDLGVTIIPSAATGGAVVALDAAALLLGAGDVRVETARHATLSLDDAGAGTPEVALWQRNLVALLAEPLCRRRVARMRSPTRQGVRSMAAKISPASSYNKHALIEAERLIAAKRFDELTIGHLEQVAGFDEAQAARAAALREHALKAKAANTEPSFGAQLAAFARRLGESTKDAIARAATPLASRLSHAEARLDVLEQRAPAGVKWAGVFTSDVQYRELTTRSGCLWLAQRDTTSKPGSGNSDWRLVVKSGYAQQE